MSREANFEITGEDTKRGVLFLKDVGPWDRHMTITNDAEGVIIRLVEEDRIRLDGTPRIIYTDSEGEPTELVHHDGEFVHFAPGDI